MSHDYCDKCGQEVPLQLTFSVTIDGQPNTLRYESFSGARGHQYLTRGNASSHAFNRPLRVGDRFHTNGHHYVILSCIDATWMEGE